MHRGDPVPPIALRCDKHAAPVTEDDLLNIFSPPLSMHREATIHLVFDFAGRVFERGCDIWVIKVVSSVSQRHTYAMPFPSQKTMTAIILAPTAKTFL